jgi:hypothetical protein
MPSGKTSPPPSKKQKREGQGGENDVGRDVYDGERDSEGKEHGKGVMLFEDGSKYEGQWENGERAGQGTARFKDGGTYEGEWSKNLLHGTGKYTAEEFEYEGEFLKDMKTGHGVCTHVDGRICTGQFKEDEMHGEGVCKYGDGKRVYTGQFQNDNMHGQGCFLFSDGTKYEGEWADDNMHGKGVIHSADGKKSYEGQWAVGFKTLPIKLNGEAIPCSHATWSSATNGFDDSALVRTVPAAAEARIENAAQIKGSVALIDRGRGKVAAQACSFPDKVRRAVEAGAVGVIIANTMDCKDPAALFSMGGTGAPAAGFGVPAVSVSYTTAAAIDGISVGDKARLCSCLL